VQLLVKNLGMDMPQSVVREELESLNIRVQGVTQLRSGRREQDHAKDRLPTPQFIVSVARGPEVSRVQSITEICGLRVLVESYVAPKGPLQCKRCRAMNTRSETAVTHPVASRVGAPTSQEAALPRENSSCPVAAGKTTRRITGAALNGRKRSPHLQSRRPILAVRAPPQSTLPLPKNSRPGPLPSRWNWARGEIT
jgi:hypothetical protein